MANNTRRLHVVLLRSNAYRALEHRDDLLQEGRVAVLEEWHLLHLHSGTRERGVLKAQALAGERGRNTTTG